MEAECDVRLCLVCLMSGVLFVVVVVVIIICCCCGEIYVGTVVFSPVHNKLMRMRIIT